MAGGRPKTVSSEKLKEAIHKHGGILATIATHVGMTRQGLWKRINAEPELKEAVAEAREAILDAAEGALQAAIRNKEPWAIRLVLLTLGKDRGYSRQVNLTGSVESTGVVRVLNLPSNGRDG